MRTAFVYVFKAIVSEEGYGLSKWCWVLGFSSRFYRILLCFIQGPFHIEVEPRSFATLMSATSGTPLINKRPNKKITHPKWRTTRTTIAPFTLFVAVIIIFSFILPATVFPAPHIFLSSFFLLLCLLFSLSLSFVTIYVIFRFVSQSTMNY